MIIQNDETLRRFIPNTLVTVQGETSLYGKLSVELHLSEMWLTKLIGALQENDLTMKVVSTDAFLRAVPSLDLVLTPNGFGIVSNNTVAPASKDRVERLMSSLKQNRDFALDQLLNELLLQQPWRETAQGRYFLHTLFQTPLALPADLHKHHALDFFLQAHAQLVLIETELAEKFISQPVYEKLRTDIDNPEYACLIEPLKAIELQLLSGQPLPYKQLVSLVDYIRTNSDTFTEWKTSSTAELYSPHYFQNEKNSSAYWW